MSHRDVLLADAGVGRVVGTADSTPLTFTVALAPDRVVQLDDVMTCDRALPGCGTVTVSGGVTQIRARHEGARFDSEVFLAEDGVLRARTTEPPDLAPGAALADTASAALPRFASEPHQEMMTQLRFLRRGKKIDARIRRAISEARTRRSAS